MQLHALSARCTLTGMCAKVNMLSWPRNASLGPDYFVLDGPLTF